LKYKRITGILALLVGIIFFGFNYEPLGTAGNVMIHIIGMLFIIKGFNILFHKESKASAK